MGTVRGAGRPEATSHGQIEEAAFLLFSAHGFEGTTLDMIAAAVGVSRRTLFRYYPSKNDIPWGQFDLTLEQFRNLLDQTPDAVPVWEGVHRAVRTFNEFPAGARPPHHERMRLIRCTPALQAHSVLRYADWRAVIAEHVARRLGLSPTDPTPRLAGHLSLALAHSAYDAWLEDPSAPLADLVSDQMALLREYLT